ncbi:hypothetical protein PgNI_06228 [Pyricularia grisea]|uniref:2EXR domain-containing protein n=1 Tax=Pyricularia grisea TaxID=148305 RepID=A0A6P8B5A2_PYRGI|nr:hypothetical protein PgNI_06228 [Pyricularia grisea]TLD10435.1 hypothetical protein PgNI_06228 [Pyricularia grisea]
MSLSTTSFPSFGLLPVELQLQIWKEALAPVTVLYLEVRRLPDGKHNYAAKLPKLAVTVYGAKPHNVGQSCKTARTLMKQTFGSPLRLKGSASARWVNLDRTVIHIGDPVDAATILDALEPGDLPRIRHVVLPWRSDNVAHMITACRMVSTRCKHLSSMTFNPYFNLPVPARKCRCHAMDEQITSFYAAIPDYSDLPWWDYSMDLMQTRSRLLPYFDNPRPRMHMVPFHLVRANL